MGDPAIDRPAIAAASLFALGVTASSVSVAPTRAETVDVTPRERWWLTPYKASKPWTIGVSCTDTSISYIAALQKAVQAKAKEMGVKIIEVDAKNDTNVELAMSKACFNNTSTCCCSRGEPESFGRFDRGWPNKAKVHRHPLQYPR